MQNVINYLLKRFKFLHYCGIHNEDCRRRIYTTKNKYLCLRTGNTHKKFKL
jgi:hypothetical protein